MKLYIIIIMVGQKEKNKKQQQNKRRYLKKKKIKHTRNDELEKENTKRAQSRETVWPSSKAAGW